MAAKRTECKFFNKNGCRNGANCSFAHNQVLPAGDCRLYNTKDSCKAPDCKFHHVLRPCWWFTSTGFCKYGDKCHFHHEKPAPKTKSSHAYMEEAVLRGLNAMMMVDHKAVDAKVEALARNSLDSVNTPKYLVLAKLWALVDKIRPTVYFGYQISYQVMACAYLGVYRNENKSCDVAHVAHGSAMPHATIAKSMQEFEQKLHEASISEAKVPSDKLKEYGIGSYCACGTTNGFCAGCDSRAEGKYSLKIVTGEITVDLCGGQCWRLYFLNKPTGMKSTFTMCACDYEAQERAWG
jgi:hypothetical protein